MIADLERLDWFPFFASDYLGSTRVQLMEDFQRGWYLNLMAHSAQSHPVGYLIHDESLWRLAGARSRAFFEQHKAAVLACFQCKKDESGREWLYQPRTIEILREQSERYRRQRDRSEKGVEAKKNGGAGSTSPSGSPSGSFYRPSQENCVQTPEGLHAMSYAHALLEAVCLPITRDLMQVVAATITAVAAEREITEALAHDWLLARAREDKMAGIVVNRFWFTDPEKYSGIGKPDNRPRDPRPSISETQPCGQPGCDQRVSGGERFCSKACAEWWENSVANPKNRAARQGRQEKA